MKPQRKTPASQTEGLIDFLKSTDFSNAIMLGIALIIPVLLGGFLDAMPIGISITIGTLLASPSDVSGNIRLRITGIFLATILAVFSTLVGGYFHTNIWIFLPILGILMFGISYLSIYGFRASLISFSGLFALILSFSNISVGFSPVQLAAFIGIGGLWYLILSFIYHSIFHKAPIDELLSKAIKLTSKYLKIRGKLIDPENNREELSKNLFQIQIELTETHEKLRELLISNRKDSGKSNYQIKRLLIFTELIDLLEIAISNPVNYDKTDLLFQNQSRLLLDSQNLLFSMAKKLNKIAKNLSTPEKIKENNKIENYFKRFERNINQFGQLINNQFDGNLLMVKNFYKYQKHQIDSIQKIEWILKNDNQLDHAQIKKKDFRRFLTQPNYDINLLVGNFNFKSLIFRHSIRLSIVTIVAYIIGLVFDLQNSYWILLTVIVIMRPTYGLTKTRSKQRILGTLIGGAIAIAIVFMIQNTTIYAILAIISLIISFAMLQKNYKSSAAFITLSVVFMYALMVPNVFDVIQYRIIDTLIGTGLAIMGNFFLWPAWEIKSIDTTLLNTLKANRNYLTEVAKYYNEVGEPSQDYKFARKKAFIAISDLHSSFQRMTQEPKSQHKHLEKIYEIALLNHSFLVATASLGTYTLHNPTTPASDNFNKVIDYIQNNLISSELILQKKQLETSDFKNTEQVIDATFGHDIKNLVNLEELEDSLTTNIKIEEAHLVFEQLKWMLDLSKKILRELNDFNFK